MGPLSGNLGMLPGMGQLKKAELDTGALKQVCRDHRLDDPPRTLESADPQRQPEEADRPRLGSVGSGDQPASQTIRPDEEDDEDGSGGPGRPQGGAEAPVLGPVGYSFRFVGGDARRE